MTNYNKYFSYDINADTSESIRKVTILRNGSDKSDLIATFNQNKTVAFFNTINGKKVFSRMIGKKPIIGLVTSKPSSREDAETPYPIAASISADNKIMLISSLDGSSIKTVKPKNTEVRSIALHYGPISSKSAAVEMFLVIASSDLKLFLWNLSTNICTKVFKGHRENIYSINITEVDKVEDGWSVLLISTSADKTARSWDLTKGGMKHIFRHKSTVGASCMSKAGVLVTGTSDGKIFIWDEGSAILLITLKGHLDAIFCLDFWYGEEVLLVSCSMDHSVRVWDIEKGENVATLLGHECAVRSVCVAYFPDSRIISCGADGTVKVEEVTIFKTLLYRVFIR